MEYVANVKVRISEKSSNAAAHKTTTVVYANIVSGVPTKISHILSNFRRYTSVKPTTK